MTLISKRGRRPLGGASPLLPSALRLSLGIFSLLFPSFLGAYVGPGAGFAFLGSFFLVFLAFFFALFNLITLPFRALVRRVRRLRRRSKSRFRRVILLGFDGMDYTLTEGMMDRGELPNFDRLRKEGSFCPLRSTDPPLSPVAWSTFATGVNPGKHNIFDFLSRDPKNYLPLLSCSSVHPGKSYRWGRWLVPLSKARISLLRKSRSYWSLLGQEGIPSLVLRVPITFPPEKFKGIQLAGLGTPDLRGTQGSSTLFSTSLSDASLLADNRVCFLEREGEILKGEIEGPPHPFLDGSPLMRVPFTLRLLPDGGAELKVQRERVVLRVNAFSPWVRIAFSAGPLTVWGLSRWVLRRTEPDVEVYLAPLQIDPEEPSMPISYPGTFAPYLAKRFGSFATLGMAEDTWALNEAILDDRLFLDQVYDAQVERERAFWDGWEKQREGVLTAVFEATDRIQHMFWRYTDSSSPAPRDTDSPASTDAIPEVYRRMDRFLGEVLSRKKSDEAVLVVSDHGFNLFRRGFHLNSWLKREGYLVLQEGFTESGKWFANVDWSKTKAYGTGLSGLFLNRKGRERDGFLTRQEAEALQREIQEKLTKVKDGDERVFDAVFRREEIYEGPYVENAPDIVLGYRPGFRVSWESAVGFVDDRLLSDNTRRWSGDHSFTAAKVPGIFFSDRKVGVTDPGLIDIAPTLLSLFGVPKPSFLEGRDLEVKG